MGRTAIVTGATGHLGAAVVRALLDDGWLVRAVGPEPVDRDVPGLDGLEVERVQADVRDADQVAAAFAGGDAAFNLAGRISIAARDPLVGPINVGGVANVVDACRAAGVPRLVHVSSIHALSHLDEHRPGEERRPTDGRREAPYDRSKARGEAIVRDAAANDLDAVVVNPTGIIGPYDHGPSMLGLTLLDVWRRKLPAVVPGGFSWVDVRDVASGILAAEARGVRGERYVLAGTWTTVRDLVDAAAAIGGVAPPRVVLPTPVARVAAAFAEPFNRRTGRSHRFTASSLDALGRYRTIDHERATEVLGYQPRPLADTLADTRAWFVEAGMLP